MDSTGQGTIVRVVRIFDRAIAWSDGPKAGYSNVQAYVKLRDAMPVESLVTIAGKRPMVFHVRRLKRSETRTVASNVSQPNMREDAFALGVTQVDMPDGRVMRPARERWGDDELDAFDFVDVEDIGQYVMQRASFPFDSPGPYGAPPSSLGAMSALLYPYAAPTLGGAPSGSEQPKDP